MVAYFSVAIGGALGSVARFWFSGVVARWFGETFPWGTMLVNISGSFAIGVLAALLGPDSRWIGTVSLGRRVFGPSDFRQFFMIGICGGYTTFSSFSLQTLNLLRDREWFYAGGNIVLSVVLCLIAVWLGYLLGAAFNTLKGY